MEALAFPSQQFFEELLVSVVGSGIAILGALWIADRSAKHADKRAAQAYRQALIDEENRRRQMLQDEENRRAQMFKDDELRRRQALAEQELMMQKMTLVTIIDELETNLALIAEMRGTSTPHRLRDRGFGMAAQVASFLPEPVGDAIHAAHIVIER